MSHIYVSIYCRNLNTLFGVSYPKIFSSLNSPFFSRRVLQINAQNFADRKSISQRLSANFKSVGFCGDFLFFLFRKNPLFLFKNFLIPKQSFFSRRVSQINVQNFADRKSISQRLSVDFRSVEFCGFFLNLEKIHCCYRYKVTKST